MCAWKDKTLICVMCPNSCELSVREKQQGLFDVYGACCSKGIDYGIAEATDPERILTTTVKVSGGVSPLVPVRSSAPMKKWELQATVQLLSKKTYLAPIVCGDILDEKMGINSVKIIATGESCASSAGCEV